MKKTQYMTNLPTFSQIKSTNLTYEDINFGITVTIIKIDKKSLILITERETSRSNHVKIIFLIILILILSILLINI